MLIDLQSNLASALSMAASVDASSAGTSDGAWKDCGAIIGGTTTLLFTVKAAAGTLTACPVTVEESTVIGGTGNTAIAEAAFTASLTTAVHLKRFQRSKQFCRVRVGTTAGTATAAICTGVFIGQKQVVV